MTKLLPVIALSLTLCACASGPHINPAVEAANICPVLQPLPYSPVDRNRKPMLQWLQEQLPPASVSTPVRSSTTPSKPTTTTTR